MLFSHNLIQYFHKIHNFCKHVNSFWNGGKFFLELGKFVNHMLLFTNLNELLFSKEDVPK